VVKEILEKNLPLIEKLLGVNSSEELHRDYPVIPLLCDKYITTERFFVEICIFFQLFSSVIGADTNPENRVYNDELVSIISNYRSKYGYSGEETDWDISCLLDLVKIRIERGIDDQISSQFWSIYSLYRLYPTDRDIRALLMKRGNDIKDMPIPNPNEQLSRWERMGRYSKE